MVSEKSLTVQTQYRDKPLMHLNVFATWVLAIALGAAFWTLLFTRVFPMLMRLVARL